MAASRPAAFRRAVLLWLVILAVVAPASSVLAQSAAPPSGPRQEQRIALVIGNAAYKEAPLRNPINDARAVAETLRRLNFEVTTFENVSQRDMARAIIRFGERLAEGGVGLFYFSGHGMQVRGRNYLIPVDAEITSENSIRAETVDVDLVLDQMGAAANRLNLVILDACRNNPFERRFRGAAGGLAQVNAPRGTLIAYATAPGSVAADGEGKNGIYTSALLRAMRKPGVPVEEVFKDVRAEVAKQTNDAQVPWEASSLTGSFYFAGPTTVVVQPPPAAESDKELVFYNAIKDSKEPGAFEAYLRQYPNGAFAELARFRLQQLKPPPSPPAKPPETPAVQIDDVAGTYVALRRANVREEPSTAGKSVGVVESGATLAVTGRASGTNWFRVSIEGKRDGWIFGDNIEDMRVAEAKEWSRLKNSPDRAAFQTFLKTYPAGEHATEARNRLDTLEREERERREKAAQTDRERAAAAAAAVAPAAAAKQPPPPAAPPGKAENTASDTKLAAATPRTVAPPRPSSAADGVAFRCPTAGTIIETSTGNVLTFIPGKDFRCRFKNQSGTVTERFAMLLAGNSAWINSGGEKLTKLWPLRVGNEQWFVYSGTTVSGNPGSWYHTFTVKRTERLTVKAGTFNTFVIEHREQGALGNTADSVDRYWFAPDVGYFVKYEFSVINARGNYGERKDWEAVRVTVP
jgi:uncharacterized caspase-like protein